MINFLCDQFESVSIVILGKCFGRFSNDHLEVFESDQLEDQKFESVSLMYINWDVFEKIN